MTDYRVTEAVIDEPARGAWVADIVSIDRPESGTITILDQDWIGTLISEPVQDGGVWRSRLVAGNRRLNQPLSFKQYRGSVPLSTIVSDAIKAAGESAGTITTSARVEHYQRSDQSLAALLDIACSFAACVWYMDRSGRICFEGERQGRASAAAAAPVVAADAPRSETLALESFAALAPGDRRESGTVMGLRWVLSARSLLAEISYDLPWLDKPDQSWYGRVHRAQVESQNIDYSVSVIVDSRFALKDVPLLSPAKTILNPGDLVSVGFYGWDPRKPYAIPADNSKTIDLGKIQYVPGSASTMTWIPPATKENPAPEPVTVNPAGVAFYGVIR